MTNLYAIIIVVKNNHPKLTIILGPIAGFKDLLEKYKGIFSILVPMI